MLYRLMNGNSIFLGKAFTMEARHRYTALWSWQEQRQILWIPITPYDDQPKEDEIVDLEEVEVIFGLKQVTYN